LDLVGRGDLGLSVVLAAVGEPRQASGEEPPGDAVDLGLRAEPAVGDPGRGRAADECEDDLATAPQSRVAGAMGEPPKFLPLGLRERLPRVDDLRSDQGGTPSTGVFGDTTEVPGAPPLTKTSRVRERPFSSTGWEPPPVA